MVEYITIDGELKRFSRKSWDHEALYETRNGKWILHSWVITSCQGCVWRELTSIEAEEWLRHHKD